MDFIQHAAQMLLDGVDGAEVMNKLRYAFVDEDRTEPRTLSSLNTVMTQVREEVIARGCRSPAYDPTKLIALSHAEPDIQAFLMAPLRLQYGIQRAHATKPSWSAAAEMALSQLQILPKSMNTFKLSQAQVIELKQAQEAAQLTKNENVIVVQDATVLLKAAVTMVEHADVSHSFASLVLPLALLSGRRQTELLNGKSTFSPSARGATYTVFEGQLKKQGKAEAYTIPLLCEYATFLKGWSVLRERQSMCAREAPYSKVAVQSLSNKQVKTRYQKSLARALKYQKPAIRGLPRGIKEHDLRSMYAAFAFHCYDCRDTFARTAMHILGHSTLQESLSYNNVRLENADALRKAFGSYSTDR